MYVFIKYVSESESKSILRDWNFPSDDICFIHFIHKEEIQTPDNWRSLHLLEQAISCVSSTSEIN